jgi:hypothetical protein
MVFLANLPREGVRGSVSCSIPEQRTGSNQANGLTGARTRTPDMRGPWASMAGEFVMER